MANKNKKNIKLDDLAGMIKRGFDGVDKRFDENTKDHRSMMARLDNLGNSVEEINLKLTNVAYRFEVVEIDRKLKRVESRLGMK